jgi:D-glycero-alpha-D-manno-heptose-7-phosphate kinase
MADVPSGTGLGSSGSFTTALLKALGTYFNKPIHAEELAKLACKIEIEILKEPIGKQDQYIAAFGGFTAFHFRIDGNVDVKSLELRNTTIHDLEDNLLLFYTGTTRSASSILKEQDSLTKANDSLIQENLDFIKKLGYRSQELLMSGDTFGFGQLMNEHWEYKRLRTQGMTNELIDMAYSLALKNGAVGGKLVGAGGGGFLLFYSQDNEKLRKAMSKLGLEEIRFKFDFQGTSVVIS